MASTLDRLVSALESAPDYSYETLEQILADNPPDPAEVRAIAEAVFPYGRTMVKMTDVFEVIIGCWPQNGWCDAHDHGDAIGLVYSCGGEVEHFDYRMVGDMLELYHQSTITGGQTMRLPAGMIHSLQNISSAEPYVGLHIYVPPTKDVRVFDTRNGDIYHVTDDAAAIIPSDESCIRSVERRCFTFKNLVRHPEVEPA